MAENQILQAINNVEIEGILMEKTMEFKTVKGREAIAGKLDIKTDDNSIHTVKVFSYLKKIDKVTKVESDNGIAKGLITIKNEFKTVAEHEEENAERVRITSGQIEKNEYFGQDGQLKSYLQYSTNFINRVKAGDVYNPRATFEIETYIQALVPEIKNDEETGRIIIKGLVPLYGGKIIPLDFVVEDKKAIGYIEANYEVGNTVKLTGLIVNTATTIKTVEEMAFGDDIEKIKTTTVRELLVKGGLPPYDEGNIRAYTVDQIKKALVERESKLEELKAKAKEETSTSNTQAGGFDVGDTGNGSKQTDAYDIPF